MVSTLPAKLSTRLVSGSKGPPEPSTAQQHSTAKTLRHSATRSNFSKLLDLFLLVQRCFFSEVGLKHACMDH